MHGIHNSENAELAVAMAHTVNVPMDRAFRALTSFEGVDRRLNLLFETDNLKIWDDFAHHPTAIEATLDALRTAGTGHAPLIAVIELRSNTMKAGIHGATLLNSATHADQVIWVLPADAACDSSLLERTDGTSLVVRDASTLEDELAEVQSGQIIFMSNGGFSGIQDRVVGRIRGR